VAVQRVHLAQTEVHLVHPARLACLVPRSETQELRTEIHWTNIGECSDDTGS
jgi:hypothetical protein